MNPDLQHKREYEKYLEHLTLQGVLNLTPLEESWRLARIDSVTNMLNIVNERLGR